MKKIFTKIFTHEALPFLEIRHTNSNKHYKEHFHDTFSIGVMKEGMRGYTNQNNKYVLGVNQLSIINPNEVHACNPVSDNIDEYFMIYLDTSWCLRLQRQMDNSLQAFVPSPMDFIEDEAMYSAFSNLCELLFEDVSIEEKNQALEEFFIEFFGQYLRPKDEVLNQELFENVVTYMNENYDQNIVLDELAMKFDTNIFQLIRVFKSQMNLTPRAYLLNVRINESKKLLQKGMSIVDTALNCGFVDQSHFHKNFVKITATTPKEYRVNFIQ